MYEHGPFSFAPAPLAAAKPDGAGGARLTLNPYAWSTVAHVIYLDSPAGVGLSYSETRADYVTNDTATAADADAFLRSFMARYPRFADNELYIAGESYAGIYVPNLARAVLRNNAAGATPTLNLLVRLRIACVLSAYLAGLTPRCARRGTRWATGARTRRSTAMRLCRSRSGRASSPRTWPPPPRPRAPLAAAARRTGTPPTEACARRRWMTWTWRCRA